MNKRLDGTHLVPGTNTAVCLENHKTKYSWGLPPEHACLWKTSQEKDPRSVCTSCYVKNYVPIGYPRTSADRWKWTKQAMDGGIDSAAYNDWVKGITAAFARAGRLTGGFFRIHDSGDFFNVPYITAITRVCESTPHIRYWIPTRAYLVRPFVKHLNALASLPNVSLRPSALRVGDDAPSMPGWAPGHAVNGNPKKHKVCPTDTDPTLKGICLPASCPHPCYAKDGPPISFNLTELRFKKDKEK